MYVTVVKVSNIRQPSASADDVRLSGRLGL